MKRVSIKYPKIFHEIARQLSEARTRLSLSYYKKGSEKYRGDKEAEISKLGMLAELIAMHSLAEGGKMAEFTRLINTTPQVKPDITLENGDTIDVKGLKGNILRVNAKAHENMKKRPKYYWFIKPSFNWKINRTSTYIAENYIFESSKVDNWNKTESTFTPVYQFEVDNE